MQEMQVRPLVREYSLEEEMTTHSSIFAYKIPWRSLVDCSPWGRRAHAHTAQAFVAGEPLGASPIPGRCSCLGPGMDKKSRDSLGPPGVRVAFGPLGAQLVFSGLGSPCLPLSLARGAAGRSPKPGVSASKCGCCYFPLECPSLLSSLSSHGGAGPPEQGERGTHGSQDNLAS